MAQPKLIEALRSPLNLILIRRDRLQEAVDDAVARGRMTRADAEDLVREVVSRGMRESQDLLADVEQLLGRGKGSIEQQARKAPGAERALRGIDKVRRGAGLPPSFPISNYDDLTAAQINECLGGLTPAGLRKVRDYERRHGNRKSVLSAVEKALG